MDKDWKFVDWSLRGPRGTIFNIYSQPPNKVKVVVLGNYPKGLEPGHPNARAILFQEIYEDDILYELMKENTRLRRKKKAELFKYAYANVKEDPNKKY
ncbi:MAG: hypothetical protein N2250_09395 [Pseudothermotoga sp.]|nr:hypothetical protein [Pseudothermotoga sp.]